MLFSPRLTLRITVLFVLLSISAAIELMQDAKYDSCSGPYPPTTCKPDSFPSHNYTHSAVETANVALSAGTDVNCGEGWE